MWEFHSNTIHMSPTLYNPCIPKPPTTPTAYVPLLIPFHIPAELVPALPTFIQVALSPVHMGPRSGNSQAIESPGECGIRISVGLIFSEECIVHAFVVQHIKDGFSGIITDESMGHHDLHLFILGFAPYIFDAEGTEFCFHSF